MYLTNVFLKYFSKIGGLLRILAIHSGIEDDDSESSNDKATQSIPLVIVGPSAIGEFLKECASILCRAASKRNVLYEFVHCMEFNKVDCGLRQLVLSPLSPTSLYISNLISVPVIHCHDSYGVILNISSGHSIAYSGDTRPCYDLIQAAKAVDLVRFHN